MSASKAGSTPAAKAAEQHAPSADRASRTVDAHRPAALVERLQALAGNQGVSAALAPAPRVRLDRDLNRIWSSATAGAPVALPYRRAFEASFGADFSTVEVWLGRSAPLRAIGAVAATSGEQVVFTDRHPGRRVIAHELAHVLQYRLARGAVSARTSRPGDTAERRADQAAGCVERNEPSAVEPVRMASIMREASAEPPPARVTFADLQRDYPDVARLFVNLSMQYRVLEEEVFPVLVEAGIRGRESPVSIQLGAAQDQVHGLARAMAEQDQYTAQQLAHWVDAMDNATGGWLLAGIDQASRQPADAEADAVLEAARGHRDAMRASIATLNTKSLIERGRAEAKGRQDLPRPPAQPEWQPAYDKTLADLALAIDTHLYSRVVPAIQSFPPALRRELLDRFKVRVGTDLLVRVRDECPEVLADVMVLLADQLTLAERLDVHITQGMLGPSANDEAILEILRSSKSLITALEADERARLVGELSKAMSPDAFFAANKLLRPDDPVAAVEDYVKATAAGWGWDDNQGVYDALVALEPEQRSAFWSNQANRALIAKIDPLKWPLIEAMCSGTESDALKVRAFLATWGGGTTESGLEAVASRAQAATRREQETAPLRALLEQAEAAGALDDQGAAALAALRRLDVQRSGVLSIDVDATGAIDAGTVLGMIRGDVDRSEFQRLAADMGVDNTQLAGQKIRDASGLVWDTEQEMYDAIQSMPADERARMAAMLGRGGEEMLSAADPSVADALAGLSPAEQEVARDYAGADAFRIAMRRLQAGPPYMETLRILAGMSAEERHVRMLQGDENVDIWYALWRRRDPAIGALLDPADEFPAATILQYALGRSWDGTSEELVFFALERLPPAQRKQYRDGYWLARTGRPVEQVAGGQEALDTFNALNDQLAGEMGGPQLQTAYDQLLGPPSAADILAANSADSDADLDAQQARRQTADIIYFRVREKFGTRGGLADVFTESDETLRETLVQFETHYRAAIEDGVVTAHELAELAALGQRFNQRYTEYLGTTSAVADVAAMITATAAGIAIAAATGGLAAPAVGATWASFGLSVAGGAAIGAVTQVATKELFLADRFDVTDEQGLNEALAGAVDGALAVATAGVGGRIKDAVLSGAKLKDVNLARSLLQVGEDAVAQSGHLSAAGKHAGRSLLGRIRDEAIESAIEESIGGAFSELVMTATDENTYDKTMWDVLAAFGWASLSGAGMGAAGGGLLGGAFATGGELLGGLGRRLEGDIADAAHVADIAAAEPIVTEAGGDLDVAPKSATVEEGGPQAVVAPLEPGKPIASDPLIADSALPPAAAGAPLKRPTEPLIPGAPPATGGTPLKRPAEPLIQGADNEPPVGATRTGVDATPSIEPPAPPAVAASPAVKSADAPGKPAQPTARTKAGKPEKIAKPGKPERGAKTKETKSVTQKTKVEQPEPASKPGKRGKPTPSNVPQPRSGAADAGKVRRKGKGAAGKDGDATPIRSSKHPDRPDVESAGVESGAVQPAKKNRKPSSKKPAAEANAAKERGKSKPTPTSSAVGGPDTAHGAARRADAAAGADVRAREEASLSEGAVASNMVTASAPPADSTAPLTARRDMAAGKTPADVAEAAPALAPVRPVAFHATAVGHGAFTFHIVGAGDSVRVVIRDAGGDENFFDDAVRFLLERLQAHEVPSQADGRFRIDEISISHMHPDHFSFVPGLIDHPQLRVERIVVNEKQTLKPQYRTRLYEGLAAGGEVSVEALGGPGRLSRKRRAASDPLAERDKRLSMLRGVPVDELVNAEWRELALFLRSRQVETRVLPVGSEGHASISEDRAHTVHVLPERKVEATYPDTLSSINVDTYEEVLVASLFDSRERDVVRMAERLRDSVARGPSQRGTGVSVLMEGHHWLEGAVNAAFIESPEEFAQLKNYVKILADLRAVDPEGRFIAATSVGVRPTGEPELNLRKAYLMAAAGYEPWPLHGGQHLSVVQANEGSVAVSQAERLPAPTAVAGGKGPLFDAQAKLDALSTHANRVPFDTLDVLRDVYLARMVQALPKTIGQREVLGKADLLQVRQAINAQSAAAGAAVQDVERRLGGVAPGTNQPTTIQQADGLLDEIEIATRERAKVESRKTRKERRGEDASAELAELDRKTIELNRMVDQMRALAEVGVPLPLAASPGARPVDSARDLMKQLRDVWKQARARSELAEAAAQQTAAFADFIELENILNEQIRTSRPLTAQEVAQVTAAIDQLPRELRFDIARRWSRLQQPAP